MTEAKKDGEAEELKARVRVLEEHVRHMGNMSDICTYPVLKRICDYCECPRQRVH